MRLAGQIFRANKASKTFLHLFLFLSLTSVLYAATPLIRADDPDHDFGTIYRGETAEHEFIISNAGNAPLEIKNVRSSCGCTVPTISKRILEPRESTKLKAVFNSGRFSGHVIKNIYVYSNDPENGIKKLSIQANIRVDLDIRPPNVYFAGLKEGEKVERNIVIKNLSEDSVTIKEIASTVASINLELSKMNIEPGDSANLRLVVNEVKKKMKLSGELTVFNTSHQPELKVRVYGGVIK